MSQTSSTLVRSAYAFSALAQIRELMKNMRAGAQAPRAREQFGGLFECLFGLNREAYGHLGQAVEYFQNVIAKQAAELTLGSGP